jgi:hypothetical protein
MKAILYLDDKKVKNGKIDLKNSAIYNGNMSENKSLCSVTEKGYYSIKPIYVDFATECRIKLSPTGKKYIEITDDEYDYLLKNYTEKGKIFQTYEQKMRTLKAIGNLAWCSAMKDPYDRG